ncbi:MAG: polysaccharide lyase family 8 super-sandwich domain-containing protein [Chitinivibrionales bacterium]|nr:polysaccharide lyase family 8 super-sandwich domain-containing protein [Chitinivibrionales bacterium]
MVNLRSRTAGHKIFLVLLILCAIVAAADIDTLSARLYTEFQGNGASAMTIRQWLGSLKTDGTWPDINYADSGRAVWAPSTHVSRLFSMAQAYCNPAHALYDSVSVRDGFLRAFDAWIRLDPQSPNWWFNQIGVQLALGPAMILMKNLLSASQLYSGDVILARSWAVHATMTGENLVWVSKITIWRGCIMDTVSLITDAVSAVTSTIQVATQPSEGIQQDWSFHQHGPQLYSGGYGLNFSSDNTDIARLCRATQFAFPQNILDVLSGSILDGQQWMMRGTTIDESTVGRGVTRPNTANQKGAFVTICDNMSLATSARTQEFTAFLNRLNAWPSATAVSLAGNRHFWCSDYMTHQRPGYMASVKMSSKRTTGAERINGEGDSSYYLGDGVTFFYRSGAEYLNIFPVWDWTLLPGVTCRHDITPPPLSLAYVKGATDFVGGVSDGTYGVTGFDYARDNVAGRKALFFFDKEIAALGAGITGAPGLPVYTSVNQCLQKGPVTVSANGLRSSLAAGTSHLSKVAWIHHDSIGYFPLNTGDSMIVQSGTRTSSWRNINESGSASPVLDTVFGLWFNHGTTPSGASYAYAVVPGVTADGLDAYVKNMRRCRILSNTSSVQAVRDDSLGVSGYVFYTAGSAGAADSLHVGVDQPCIVLTRESKDSLSVAASNPLNTAVTVQVTVSLALTGAGAVWNAQTSTANLSFVLPGGLDAGKSVVMNFRKTGATAALPPVSGIKYFSCKETAGTINYALPTPAFVSLKYYDLQGRTVCSFVNNFQQPGNYTLKLPVAPLARNVYIREFKAGDFVTKEQVAVIK